MRKFHNNIKRTLIKKYAYKQPLLLDLACGKCGDLNKWSDSRIQKVIGYDINQLFIDESSKRYSTSNSNTSLELHTLDLSKNILPGHQNINVITCMFAFHYFFESSNTFHNIIQTILNNLTPNGLFIGCLFDGKTILQNNHVCQKFKITLKDTQPGLFGNKIGVYLEDTVLNVETDEYLVIFDDFVQLMKTFNLHVIESKMFSDISGSHKMNSDEKHFSFLNRYFVFKLKK